jgi:lysozyme family protein
MLCDRRLDFLSGLKTWPRYKNGWTDRVHGVREVALEMAAAAPQKPPTDAPKPVAAPEQPAKAESAPAVTPAAVPVPSSSDRTSVFQFAWDLLLMAFGRRG